MNRNVDEAEKAKARAWLDRTVARERDEENRARLAILVATHHVAEAVEKVVTVEKVEALMARVEAGAPGYYAGVDLSFAPFPDTRGVTVEEALRSARAAMDDTHSKED